MASRVFVSEKCGYLVKVLTLLTMLITNNLSPYTTPYNFLKALTPLIISDLSPYTNDKGITAIILRKMKSLLNRYCFFLLFLGLA